MEKFEQASKLRLRFKSPVGLITTEDLWDMSLVSLDQIAKSLNKEIKLAEEESFIKTKTKASEALELGFEIVKHIIIIKLAEADAKLVAAAKKAQKAKIMELIANKETEVMSNKSLEELRAELEAL